MSVYTERLDKGKIQSLHQKQFTVFGIFGNTELRLLRTEKGFLRLEKKNGEVPKKGKFSKKKSYVSAKVISFTVHFHQPHKKRR